MSFLYSTECCPCFSHSRVVDAYFWMNKDPRPGTGEYGPRCPHLTQCGKWWGQGGDLSVYDLIFMTLIQDESIIH